MGIYIITWSPNAGGSLVYLRNTRFLLSESEGMRNLFEPEMGSALFSEH